MSIDERIEKYLKESPDAVLAGFALATKVLGAFLGGMKESQAAHGAAGPDLDVQAGRAVALEGGK